MTGDRKKQGGPSSPKSEKKLDQSAKVFERIYRLVLKIPKGRVMTYGQISRLLEGRYSPRLVGWAMNAAPHDARNIPWHRVINSKGGISTGKLHPDQPDIQRYMLEAEDVEFDDRGCCDLKVYQWSPRQRKTNGKNSPPVLSRGSKKR